MTGTQQTIRIFISSPGDVAEERDAARRVIEGLQRIAPSVTLKPVLWEDLALPATASFQETIDFLIGREPIDIAIFILWSRLGSPLGASITRRDGTPYRSGTERELDLMLTAFQQSGQQRPVILAYIREDDSAFKEKLTHSPTVELEELIQQRKLAEAFIREQFLDAQGRNLRAYQTYREPVGFAQRLRLHLRQAIDDLLDSGASPSWTEEPYRGLQAFDVHHAPIFHGRDEETCELLQRLRDQEAAGCAFVAIVGASGAGKSSLARAGVAANLLQHTGDDVTQQWRELIFLPSLATDSLCSTLVRFMAKALPELNDQADVLDDIAQGLAENPSLTVRLSIVPAFIKSADGSGGKTRLLLILDQLEELWTDRKTTAQEREQFLAAVESLACSGHVAVLATLRSDLYHLAQQSEVFLRLKGRLGQFDLLPPDAASVQRLITEPARLAGLRFERNEETGHSLEQDILQDASRDPGALPSLQYALAELYQRRDEGRRLLTFAAYEQLGGVDGALGKRANETFKQLPAEAQDALDEVLPLLVTVDVAGEQSAVRRRAPVAELSSTPARKLLTEQLTAARFLTTDRKDETPIASFAHEALLRRWDRIAHWVDANRQHLQRRARIEQGHQRWLLQGRDESLLLADGLPLEEGRQLLQDAPQLLTEPLSEFIKASIDHSRWKANRSRRARTIVAATIAGLLVLIVFGGVYVRRSTTAKSLVQGLLQANSSEVPEIVEALADYPILSRSHLRSAWENSAEDAKLHAGLAWVREDDSVLPYLTDRLLSAKPDQVETIRRLLADHQDRLIDQLWEAVEDDDAANLLPAASALAVYDGGNESRWKASSEKLVQALISENPVHFAIWLKLLAPVGRHVIDPLAEVCRNKDQNRPQTQIDLATEMLLEYATDDLDRLVELLLESQPRQFARLFDGLQSHGNRANVRIKRELEPQNEKRSSLREANAATYLLRSGLAEPLIDMMQIDLSDLGPLSEFASRCRASGVVPQELITCLNLAGQRERSATGESRDRHDRALYGILLALGEYEINEIPQPERDRLTDQLVAWYESHPSSAVHGATGWLLRRWHFDEDVLRVDRTPLPFDESLERDWYVIEVNVRPNQGVVGFLESLAGGPKPIFFTMIVFSPGEFVIGAPSDEPGFQVDERKRRVRLTRPFAMSDREVTWAQFDPYDQAGHRVMWRVKDRQARGPGEPALAVNWFEAVAYCRWLTEQTGKTHCYAADPLAADADSDPGWVDLPASTAWPVDLGANGFRLLTEAEWEWACRSGTRTAFSFGDNEQLLSDYGWFFENSSQRSHAVAQLRPNARGLFDMHGNVYEWCQDWYGETALTSEDPVGPAMGGNRVNRGGGWGVPSRSCRSADRNGYPPTNRAFNTGFRVAIMPTADR